MCVLLLRCLIDSHATHQTGRCSSSMLQLQHKQGLGCTHNCIGRPACLRLNRYLCRAKPSQEAHPQQEQTGAGLKALWYAAEVFGKAVGKGGPSPVTVTSQVAVMSRDELISSIQADYDKNYFISGAGEMTGDADNCVYSDPFVSFSGTQRFKQNVSNLGGLMSDVKLDVYEFNDLGPDKVQTRWRFSCVLDLPWKPRIAAAGSTTHVMDLSKGQVVQHIEAWDTEPEKVIKQLFRPANKMPSNAWETFFLSASEGDATGMWLSTSPLFLRLSAPIVAVSLTCKLITGEGLPGVALGAVEGVSWLLLVAAAGTELYKLVKSLTGGESL